MTVVHRPLSLQWANPGTLEPQFARLASELARWEGTPYIDQDPVPGAQGGVSCFGFVCAVLDALYGRAGSTIVGLPRDIGLHDPETAKAAMKWFLARYPVERVQGLGMQPGDILVIGHGNAGSPGHVMLVGPRKNALWHSTEDVGVHYTGLSLPLGSTHHSTYRCTNRDQWLPN